jgi:hypothetical protein
MWPFARKKTAQPEQQTQRVLSFMTPAEVQSFGCLPSEAVLGVYTDSTDSIESFRPNRTFIDFLHRIIVDVGSRSPELAAGARVQQNGWLYVIDPRTPEGPNGHVGPEDIIGAFEVRDGELVQGSYQANTDYRALTMNGSTRLTPAQRAAFLAALPRTQSTSRNTPNRS